MTSERHEWVKSDRIFIIWWSTLLHKPQFENQNDPKSRQFSRLHQLWIEFIERFWKHAALRLEESVLLAWKRCQSRNSFQYLFTL